MKTVIIDRQTLFIVSNYDGGPNQSQYGGPWGDPTLTAHVALPDGASPGICNVEQDEDGIVSLLIDEGKQADAQRQENADALAAYKVQRETEVEAQVSAILLAQTGQQADQTTHLMVASRALDIIAHAGDHSEEELTEANATLAAYRTVYSQVQDARSARDADVEAFVPPHAVDPLYPTS